MFLFTDSHVLEEGFLELVNNMLTIGMVPALFDEDSKKIIIDQVRDYVSINLLYYLLSCLTLIYKKRLRNKEFKRMRCGTSFWN